LEYVKQYYLLCGAGVGGIELYFHRCKPVRPDRYNGGRERPCEQHNLLLGGKSDQCERFKRLVDGVEFSNYSSSAKSAFAFRAFIGFNQSGDYPEPELDVGNKRLGTCIVRGSGFYKCQLWKHGILPGHHHRHLGCAERSCSRGYLLLGG
jgi:hypothetical protein